MPWRHHAHCAAVSNLAPIVKERGMWEAYRREATSCRCCSTTRFMGVPLAKKRLATDTQKYEEIRTYREAAKSALAARNRLDATGQLGIQAMRSDRSCARPTSRCPRHRQATALPRQRSKPLPDGKVKALLPYRVPLRSRCPRTCARGARRADSSTARGIRCATTRMTVRARGASHRARTCKTSRTERYDEPYRKMGGGRYIRGATFPNLRGRGTGRYRCSASTTASRNRGSWRTSKTALAQALRDDPKMDIHELVRLA